MSFIRSVEVPPGAAFTLTATTIEYDPSLGYLERPIDFEHDQISRYSETDR